MKQYEYMVTYSFEDGDGRAFITVNAPIKSRKDIETVEAGLSESTNHKCAIMNFQLLREYDDKN